MNELAVNEVAGRVVDAEQLRAQLAAAKEPEQVIAIGAAARSFEELIENAGFGKDMEKMRPYRELWLESRWMLGRMLAAMVRAVEGRPKKTGTDRTSFSGELKKLGIEKPRAIECQRLATLPKPEMQAKFKALLADHDLPTLVDLLFLAKPYWYQQKRKQTHAKIHKDAVAQKAPLGPFPLIYADPPWLFETHTPDKTHRMPDDHYPCMKDDEICNFHIGRKLVREIAAKNGVLFLWCTSSNFKRALAIIEAWGFEYKTHLIWDKLKIGLGLVFRNQHEVLIYASRGKPPKPLHIPSSVFRKRATKHSRKPPEIRRLIERMYPKFKKRTRLELFCRDKDLKGWTTHGYEAVGQATG
jgi:N6-adenosine-specific RNA methylase IME4